MRIAVNASCCEDSFNGVGRFLWNLLAEWGKSSPQHQFVVFGRTGNYVRAMPQAVNLKYVTAKSINLFKRVAEWEQFILPVAVYREGPFDVFFSPIYTLPVFVPTSRNVLQIYDVSYLSQPHSYTIPQQIYYRLFSYLSMRRADKIITGSKFSYSEIQRHLNPKADSLLLVYPGVEPMFSPAFAPNDKLILSKYGISGRYILYIGQIFTRRHVPALIKAFSSLTKAKRISDISLVLVGKNRTMPFVDLEAEAGSCGVSEKVMFVESIPDEDMPALYRNAVVFAYLSTYEGFGLPVLESLACGTPVITTNQASLPESGGEGALKISNPELIDDLANNLAALINDENLRKQLSDKGFSHAQVFNWGKCARETLRIIESA